MCDLVALGTVGHIGCGFGCGTRWGAVSMRKGRASRSRAEWERKREARDEARRAFLFPPENMMKVDVFAKQYVQDAAQDSVFDNVYDDQVRFRLVFWDFVLSF
jgi:hypothetical protein